MVPFPISINALITLKDKLHLTSFMGQIHTFIFVIFLLFGKILSFPNGARNDIGINSNALPKMPAMARKAGGKWRPELQKQFGLDSTTTTTLIPQEQWNYRKCPPGKTRSLTGTCVKASYSDGNGNYGNNYSYNPPKFIWRNPCLVPSRCRRRYTRG